MPKRVALSVYPADDHFACVGGVGEFLVGREREGLFRYSGEGYTYAAVAQDGLHVPAPEIGKDFESRSQSRDVDAIAAHDERSGGIFRHLEEPLAVELHPSFPARKIRGVPARGVGSEPEGRTVGQRYLFGALVPAVQGVDDFRSGTPQQVDEGESCTYGQHD